MIGHFYAGNSTGGDIVNGSYEAESDHILDDVETIKVTVKMSVNAACMFNAVAARFKNSRFTMLEAHFDALATQMFDALTEADKSELSLSADLEATEILKKQGLKSWSVTGAAGTFKNENAEWRNYKELSAQGFETDSERCHALRESE